MTVKSKEYYRTFMHLPPTGPSMADVQNVWKKKGYMPAPGSFEYQREAMQRPVPQLGKEHQALQISGSNLKEVRIFEKPDQNFRQVATPWELEWSRLVAIDRKRFFPVVDDKGTVIGYSGPVLSSEMWIGRPTGYALIYTAEETLKYHRMFVGNRALHAAPDLQFYGDGLNYYSVMTDTGGEITSFQYAYPSINGSAESTSLPGLAWLKVLQGGFKVLMSVRNGSRSVARPPTSPSPKPQRALPSGGATTPGTIPRAPSAPKGNMTDTPQSVSSRTPRNNGGGGGGSGSSSGVDTKARTNVVLNPNHVRQQLGLPPVTQPGRLALAQEAKFRKHLDDYMNYFERELKALKARNPNWTPQDVQAIVDRADKRFGAWLPGD